MRDGSPINGTLAFSVEEIDPACIMVSATNSANLGLWDRHIHVIALIVPRGGVTIKHNDPICH
jgi:hypothetical protein